MEETAVMIIKKKTETVVALTGPMTIERAGELREGLLEAFALGKKVQLSLAGVTEVDLTGLQLLCSAHRSALADGLEFSVTGNSEILGSVAESAGMLRHTGCVEDTSGSCIWKRGPLSIRG